MNDDDKKPSSVPSLLLSGIVVLTGFLVMLGWQFDIELFKRPIPHLVAMNPMTAAAFMISAVAVMLVSVTTSRRSISKQPVIEGEADKIGSADTIERIGKFLSLLVLLVGGLKLTGILLGLEVGVDQIFFAEKLQSEVAGNVSNRMAPNTAFCFVLLALSVLTYGYETKRKHVTSQYFALVVAFTGWLSILGYLYQVKEFYGVLTYIPMAIHTAIAFLLMSLSVLLAQRQWGLMKEFTSPLSGGIVARTLLPVAVVIPSILGYIRLQGHWAAGLDIEFGVAVLVLGIIVTFIVFTWFNTHLLNAQDLAKQAAEKVLRELNTDLEQRVQERTTEIVRAHEILQAEMNERKRKEEEVRESEERFRLVVESSPNAILMIDPKGKVVLVNARAEEYFGYHRTELIGQPIERLVPQEFRAKHENHSALYMARPDVRPMAGRELTAMRKDGTIFPVEIGLNPLATKDGTLVVCTVVDITERKRMDQGRKEAQERFEKVFYHNPLGIVLSSFKDGKYLEVNNAFLELTGFERSEVIGRTSLDLNLIAPADRSRVMEELRTEGVSKSGEAPIRTKNGESKHVRIYAQEVSIGSEKFFLAIHEDITERKQAEAQLRNAEFRYRNTLDRMLEGCQIIGFDYTYLYVNDAAAQQGRRPKQDLLGRTMMEMYPGIDETPFFRILRECMEQKIHRQIDNEFTYPDGTKGWFKLSLEPVPEGVFILSVDITKEKQLADELKEHQEHLEDLVVKRTEQLEAANKELEAFSYSVSHDLRAPLRHIHGFVEMLHKKAASIDDQSKRYLGIISDSARQMGALIDDLLVFSRLSRTDMFDGRVNMAALVNDVISNLNGEVGQRSVEWKVDELPQVRGDASMLRIVMSNLLSNAVKYTRPREKAVIEVGSKTNESGEIEFCVKDNGVGFDMQYGHKLFGVFQRLHSSSDFEGTGIGLATVRRVISRHGGRTWAESSVDQGAKIYFSLPSTKEETNAKS